MAMNIGGSSVRMGGSCYIIGITKEIRKAIGKEPGGTIDVTIEKDEEKACKLDRV